MDLTRNYDLNDKDNEFQFAFVYVWSFLRMCFCMKTLISISHCQFGTSTNIENDLLIRFS
jgi:hypothetical protein